MNDEREVPFPCTLMEARVLFRLLSRLLDAVWRTYEEEFIKSFQQSVDEITPATGVEPTSEDEVPF